MTGNVKQKELELYHDDLNPERPDRMCVSVSDLHFTDGSVGFQNLGKETWDVFYGDIAARCNRYSIKELTFILDGDIVDFIRTGKWAKNAFYPWQREEDPTKFKQILREILKDIVENKHSDFFTWVKELPGKLQADAGVTKVNTVVLVGNHDKELLSDNEALTYFYEQGLGRSLDSIPDEERKWLGRMYGDENRFLDKSIAPFLPFYYGDRGFRYFTTHGQWRDEANNRKIAATGGLPGWKNSQGWQPEVWQKLAFSPFTQPCFGDTVAAGVLSSFIYKTKKLLDERGYENPRLRSILDELDLYRPSYKAVVRVLEETRSMREKNQDVAVMRLIEDTLFECVMTWLKWPFTFRAASGSISLLLRIGKYLLLFLKLTHTRLEIPVLARLMKQIGAPFLWFAKTKDEVDFKTLKSFPAFLPEYQHYGFQIHGEGHTHVPYVDELNLGLQHPSTYINFGTWRDQIVKRKESGYRRRSILRAFYILDLQDRTQAANPGDRSFDYYTQDYILWSDKSDDLTRTGTHQPHV